jgi:riboflavin synthase
MFTGIVENVGTVQSIGHSVLEVKSTLTDVKKGESVAVNGVCLTVTDAVISANALILSFDFSPETSQRTNIGDLLAGSPVNLERALRAGERIGGHMMTGHVEGTAEIVSKGRMGNSWIFRFRIDLQLSKYMVPKGSVGVDGISLTVVESGPGYFTVSVIPHTMKNTNLATRRPGDMVNIEPDILAKYVEGLLNRHSGESNITEGFLKENGFIN